MQLNKHNVETPPERKPKWLMKGIALLAAIATLATGGVVASTAYAGGGGGEQGAGGSGGPDGAPRVFWQYKDDASGSFGPATDINSVKNAFAAAGVALHEDTGGMTPMTKAQAALNGARTECVNGFHQRHPNEGDGDCRVVAVGAMLGDGGYHGNSWEESKASHWVSLWNDYIKPQKFNYAGTRGYYVDTAFEDEPGMSVQKIMNARVCNNADYCPVDNKAVIDKLSIVVIVLDRYQPAPPIQKFTPTISTSAPHVIQEGQSITDNVTVGVKQGDSWPKDEHGNNVSITAKGYYFTGPKDVILNHRSYTGDKTDAAFQAYLNQIKNAGGVQQLGEVTKTFNSPGQQTVSLDPQKAPANTWGTWVFDSKTSGPVAGSVGGAVCAHRMSSALRLSSSPMRWKRPAGACSGSPR